MPYKPKKPCAHPGCAALTDKRLCPDHAKQEARRYERQQRDPATANRYGSGWQRARAAYLSAHPLCEMCLAGGKHVPAVLVHHRVPLADGGNNAVGTYSPCASGATAPTTPATAAAGARDDYSWEGRSAYAAAAATQRGWCVA